MPESRRQKSDGACEAQADKETIALWRLSEAPAGRDRFHAQFLLEAAENRPSRNGPAWRVDSFDWIPAGSVTQLETSFFQINKEKRMLR